MNDSGASVGSGSVPRNGSDAAVVPGSPTSDTPGTEGESVRTELSNASAIGAVSQSRPKTAMAATVNDVATQRSKVLTYDRRQRSARVKIW
jgi:hypothetical protein